MGGQNVVRLGDICEFQGGAQPPKRVFVSKPKPGYVRLLQIRDFGSDEKAVYIPQQLAKRRCGNEDIMIGRYGASVGQIHRGKSGSYNVALIKTVPDIARIDRDYFYFYLKSRMFQGSLANVSERSAQAGFSKADIVDFLVPLPAIEEQKRIVAILDEAFAAIAAATANAEKNLANARELFESLLNNVFIQKAEGWKEKTLGDVCLFQGGSQPPKSQFSSELKSGYVRLIQIRDYKTDKHIVHIPKGKARRFCSADDVMIGRYGPPLFQILRGIDGAYNVALMKAKPNEELIRKDFLYYFLKNRDILQHIIRSSSRAAGQIGLNKATLEPYPIAFPTKKKQKAIVLRLEDLQEKIRRIQNIYQHKLTAIAELKQSLLHQAFTGRLTADAKAADRVLSEAGT